MEGFEENRNFEYCNGWGNSRMWSVYEFAQSSNSFPNSVFVYHCGTTVLEVSVFQLNRMFGVWYRGAYGLVGWENCP